MSELVILARSTRKQEIDGVEYDVREDHRRGVRRHRHRVLRRHRGRQGREPGVTAGRRSRAGAFVVDNGDDFRMDDRVPLVVPEVNGDALANHQGFVANPNCSTIQMVHALAPLHKLGGLKRVVVSTYQSVSGTGSAAIKELEQQIQRLRGGNEIKREQYPYQILCNVIPQISSLKERVSTATTAKRSR